MPSLLITGTDTGVGKTIIAAALARSWQAAGLDVGVMKPVASGCARDSSGALVSPDGALLRLAAGSADAPSEITPLTFEAPLAPNVAARLEGKRVDLDALKGPLAELRRRHEWLIVEGLGGALAPLTDDVAVADWAASAELPALIVARTDLGTLNHTRLTLEALAHRGVPVVGIVLNRVHGGPPDLAEQTNPETLRRLVDVPVWGPVGFVEGIGEGQTTEAIVLRLPPLAFADEIRRRLAHL